MDINFTKKQYWTLIKAIEVGGSVYGIIGDEMRKKYKKQSMEIEDLQTYLMKFADDFGFKNITENIEGKLYLKEEVFDKIQEDVDEYNNFIFWDELIMRLGKRDFFNTITNEEQEYIDQNNGWLPKRIQECYDKWRKEFEKYGLGKF